MYLDRATLRRCAGEVMICGFRGPDVDAALKEIERDIKPLGLIAFARNLINAEHARELNCELKDLRGSRLLSIDQEGGRVARLKEGVTKWPAMAALGRIGDPALARAVGDAIGKEMRNLGFDLDFAPVLDVHTNPKNPIIGDRALGHSQEQVAALGSAFAAGMQGAHVAACGKHFPGHGDTSVDSHLDLPVIEHDRQRFAAVEWPPFAAAAAADIAAVMTAHVMCPELDRDHVATLSEPILTTYLRGHCQFRGLIVSDDIDMKALANRYEAKDIGPIGLKAGIDVFLACKDEAAMLALYGGIVRAAEDGSLPHEVLADRAARARRFRERWLLPVPSAAAAKQAQMGFERPHAQLSARLAQAM